LVRLIDGAIGVPRDDASFRLDRRRRQAHSARSCVEVHGSISTRMRHAARLAASARGAAPTPTRARRGSRRALDPLSRIGGVHARALVCVTSGPASAVRCGMSDAAALSVVDPVRSAGAGFGTVAIVLHWLLAALIVAAFFIGLSMVGLPFSPLRLRLFNWHKWIGVGALVLSAARLVWRAAGHPAPPLPRGTPAWQQTAYRATHLVFYALFFAVPLLGWAYSSAVGVPVVFLGVLPLPDFVPRDKALGDAVLKPLHELSSYLLAAIVVVHVSAAFEHQFVRRDRLLARMWPWWPTRREA
jgi:cytochrome b561